MFIVFVAICKQYYFFFLSHILGFENVSVVAGRVGILGFIVVLEMGDGDGNPAKFVEKEKLCVCVCR